MAVYLHPLALSDGEGIGLLVAGGGVGANAQSSILGRDVNRRDELDLMAVTVVSMGLGAVVLLAG